MVGVARVSEPVVNVKIAEALSEKLGIDCRPERVTGGKKPDIVCYRGGLIVAIETSFSRRDAEEDAVKRIKEDVADIAIALHLKERYDDVPERELGKLIRESRFDVKVFTSEEVTGTLTSYGREGVRVQEPLRHLLQAVRAPHSRGGEG